MATTEQVAALPQMPARLAGRPVFGQTPAPEQTALGFDWDSVRTWKWRDIAAALTAAMDEGDRGAIEDIALALLKRSRVAEGLYKQVLRDLR